MSTICSRLFTISLLLSLGGCTTTTIKTSESDDKLKLDDPQILLVSADKELKKGNRQRALLLYQAVLEKNPADIKSLVSAGNIHLTDDDPDKAEYFFAQGLKIDSSIAEFHEGMGLSLLKQKRFDASQMHLHQSVNMNPKLWRAWNGLGVLSDLKRQHIKAAEFYTHALQILPNAPGVTNNYGYSLMMNRSYTEAENKFRQGLSIDPDDEWLRNNLGICLAWQSRYEESIQELLKVMALWNAHNTAGYIAMLNSDYKMAKSYFKSSMTLSPSYNVIAANNIARLERLMKERNNN